MRAEEYYSIATAYFDLGKYPEAERWFNLARKSEKTKLASEYYLGRIAFMVGDYEDAAGRFEALLKLDQDNTTVLRSAAYSRLKAGQLEEALAHFARLETLIPESVDARYNYALALAEAGRLEEAAEKVKPYVERNPSDRDALLLLARTEEKLSRPESLDHFSAALALKEEGAVRLQLADAFERRELYARSIESYRILLPMDEKALGNIRKAEIRFRMARVMLLAGEDPVKSLDELRNAVAEGFKDSARLNELAGDIRLTEEIRRSIEEIARGLAVPAAPKSAEEQEG